MTMSVSDDVRPLPSPRPDSPISRRTSSKRPKRLPSSVPAPTPRTLQKPSTPSPAHRANRACPLSKKRHQAQLQAWLRGNVPRSPGGKNGKKWDRKRSLKLRLRGSPEVKPESAIFAISGRARSWQKDHLWAKPSLRLGLRTAPERSSARASRRLLSTAGHG
jgi:hypothetical protein